MARGSHHEDDGGVGDELDADGEALALLHAEPANARDTHQRACQRRQLHQLKHLQRSEAWQTLIKIIQSPSLLDAASIPTDLAPPAALLHAESADAWDAYQRARQRRQLHQLQHLQPSRI